MEGKKIIKSPMIRICRAPRYKRQQCPNDNMIEDQLYYRYDAARRELGNGGALGLQKIWLDDLLVQDEHAIIRE